MHLVKAPDAQAAQPSVDVCPTFGADALVADHASDAYMFPGFCVAANGDFVAAYRRGTSHTSTDGTVEVIVSSDEGATWSAPTVVLSSGSWDYRDSSLTVLNDGTIILSQSRRTSGGVESPDGCVFLISTDHGQTWGTPIVVSSAFTGWVYGGAPILELPDETLLTAVYGEDSGDANSSTRLLTSTDGGSSWSVGATIADGPADGLDYNEAGLVRTPDELVCIVRRATDGDIRRSVSTDDGATWTTPATVLASAAGWPKPIRLPDGRIVLVYRAWAETGDPGRVATSFDDGATWTTCTDLVTETGKYAYSQFDVDGDGALWLLHAYEHGTGTDGRLYLRSAAVPEVADHTHVEFDVVDLDVPSALGDLSDVDLATAAPTDGQTLVYVAADDEWVPGAGPGGTRDGWTLIESAQQAGFDAATDAGAILAVYRWGVDGSGDPYFDSAGVTDGEEAALWLDDAGNYVLVELDL